MKQRFKPTRETGAARWCWGAPEQEQKAAAFEIFEAGGKVADVQKAVGVSRATAYRWQADWKDARQQGAMQ